MGTSDGNAVAVETAALGRIVAYAAQPYAQGARVRIAVRPEAIVQSGSGAILSVEDVIFTGGTSRLELRSAGGTKIEVENPRSSIVPSAGDRFVVQVTECAATILGTAL